MATEHSPCIDDLPINMAISIAMRITTAEVVVFGDWAQDMLGLGECTLSISIFVGSFCIYCIWMHLALNARTTTRASSADWDRDPSALALWMSADGKTRALLEKLFEASNWNESKTSDMYDSVWPHGRTVEFFLTGLQVRMGNCAPEPGESGLKGIFINVRCLVHCCKLSH